MIRESDAAYLAGLFDGEGSIDFTKRKEKKKYGTYNCRRVSMEISMTDESTIRYVHDVLKVGTVTIRKPTKSWIGKKTQWRWRCSHRDAYLVAKVLWPFTQTKLHKIEQIIDHYDPKIFDGNVVSLSQYRETMNLE